MHGKSLNGYPFRVETNVNAKVVGPNRKIKQNIDKHNMATANLTEGVVKFLRGEFTESYISGLIPNIGNDFNVADQYIPAYMGMGIAGVGYNDDRSAIKVTNATGYAPSYADTALIDEILPMAKPCRAQVTKSVRSNASLSQAAALILSTAYHFEDAAETQTYSIAASETIYTKGTEFYLSESLYPGKNINQRIKSITPRTAGWVYLNTTEANESTQTLATGIIYYEEITTTKSNEQITTKIPVLSVDFSTGIMTLIPDEFVFSTELTITYDPVNFDFIRADGSTAELPFTSEGLLRTYYISELGLFSGDFNNKNSKLLARVLLDPDTPMQITEGDYVLITWQIGVYALDDSLYVDDIETADENLGEESSTLKYITQEEQTTLLWDEITEVDEDGNIIEEEVAPTPKASYTIQSVDVTRVKEGHILLTVDSAEGLYSGFTADFSCLTGTLTGTIKSITENKITVDTVTTVTGYTLDIEVTNPDTYSKGPFTYFIDEFLLNTNISCSQTLKDAPAGLAPVHYSYKIWDATDYTAENMSDSQKKSSVGLKTQVITSIDSVIAEFNDIYYLFGINPQANGTYAVGFKEDGTYQIEITPDLHMVYDLGSISELYTSGVGNLYYIYRVAQNLKENGASQIDTTPILYDTTEYQIEIAVTTDVKTNQRQLTKNIYKIVKAEDGTESRQEASAILFNNTYNPIEQKG